MSEDIRKDAGLDPAALRSDKDAEGPRSKGKRRRKVSYLTLNKIESVDFREINILRRFMNDRGKILPARQTGNTAKQQRMISDAIRQAREMALLPFVVTEMTGDRPVRRERRGDYQPYTPSAPAPEVEATAEAEAPAEA